MTVRGPGHLGSGAPSSCHLPGGFVGDTAVGICIQGPAASSPSSPSRQGGREASSPQGRLQCALEPVLVLSLLTCYENVKFRAGSDLVIWLSPFTDDHTQAQKGKEQSYVLTQEHTVGCQV